WNSNVHSYRF
nr:Chain B, Dynobactin A [synthetic construct]7R1W_G Chain G, dynobactin A [synthetic construct]7T3H_A Chain A, TRP-ASN-SER-ASN-VAL-HIS-SER-TYR-ARG-PHE [Photorhabdus australis]